MNAVEEAGTGYNQMMKGEKKRQELKFLPRKTALYDAKSVVEIEQKSEILRKERVKNEEKLIEKFYDGSFDINSYAQKAYANGTPIFAINGNIQSCNKKSLSYARLIKKKEIKPDDVTKEDLARARRKSTEGVTQMDAKGSFTRTGMVDYPSGILGPERGEIPILVTTVEGACPIKDRNMGNCMLVLQTELERREKASKQVFIRKVNNKGNQSNNAPPLLTISPKSSVVLQKIEFDINQNFELYLRALKYFLFEENEFELYVQIFFYLEESPLFKESLKIYFEKNSEFFTDFIKTHHFLVRNSEISMNSKKELTSVSTDTVFPVIAFFLFFVILAYFVPKLFKH